MNAVEENYFTSDYFFWLDAGASRFVPDIDITQKFPGPQFSSYLKEATGKALFQVYMSHYPDLSMREEPLGIDYFYDNRSYCWGGMFGVDKVGIEKVSKLVDNVLRHDMLDNNILNNEQIAIGYLLKKHSDNFVLLPHRYGLRSFELMYRAFE